jgi:tellurite resistance protein TerC
MTEVFSPLFQSLGSFSALLAQTTAPAVGMPETGNYIWVAYLGFIGLVIFFLALDLGVFHREAHEVSMKEAINWSIVWVTCGVLFSVFVYFAYERHWLGLGLNTPMLNTDTSAVAAGTQQPIVYGTVDGWNAAGQYLTGYILEKSLAMDNIFVIALIFGYFAIPRMYQHRVLFWGIIGALIMRGAMIGLGAGIIMKYQWVLILFGAFLILTAIKMALIKSESDPTKNPIVRFCKNLFPLTKELHGQSFFIKATPEQLIDPAKAKGAAIVSAMTPLFLALVMVEITDLVFAVDSIPAIFAITPDPFIVFTSNIFAILGLRALYFCLAALIAKFQYLKPALILILIFVGIKLLLLSVPPYLDFIGLEKAKPIKINTFLSLGVVLGILTIATVLSVIFPGKQEHEIPKATEH